MRLPCGRNGGFCAASCANRFLATRAVSLRALNTAPSQPFAAVAGAFSRAVALERDFGRLTFFMPLWAVAGIWLWVAAPFNPSVPALAGLTAVALVGRIAATRHASLAPLMAPSAIVCAVLIGATAVGVQASLLGTPMLERAQSVTLTGPIVSSERLSPGRQRIIVRLDESDVKGPRPRRVRLTVRGGPELPVGATIKARARLFPLRGPVMPGGYDAARRLYFDRIGASGFTYGPPTVTAAPAGGLGARIYALRQAVATRIETVMPARTAPFATAVLVGQRAMMREGDVEALRASGLGHILAISGLHMALVAGSVFATVRLALALIPAVALRYPIRKWAAAAGLVAATLYLALSGGSVATQRAYIMLVVALIAVLADRPALTMRTVAIAATVCLALDPISVLEPSFQMSFLAVVALVGAYEWWSRVRSLRPPQRERRPVPGAAFVTGLLSTSLIAGLATAPAAAFHFHRLAPLGLVANALAMPVFSLVAMPAGVVALALMPFGLDAPPLAVMDHALRAVLWVAHEVTEWSGDGGLVGRIPGPAAVLMAVGIVWTAVMVGRWRVMGLSAIAIGLLIAPLGPRPDVLVSDDGMLVAARGPDGRLALLGRADGFAAQNWLRADGVVTASGNVPCDALGCTMRLAGGAVAVPGSLRAAAEDCGLATVVVTRHRLVTCRAGTIIDRQTLRQHGSVALVREGASWRLWPAWPAGPVRPWQVPPTVERP